MHRQKKIVDIEFNFTDLNRGGGGGRGELWGGRGEAHPGQDQHARCGPESSTLAGPAGAHCEASVPQEGGL